MTESWLASFLAIFDIEMFPRREGYHSVLEQEAQECLRDDDTVVVVREPLHAAFEQLVREDA
jgi:hypothetical protein